MKKINLRGRLGNGKSVLVDDSMYLQLNKLKWRISGGYASTVVRDPIRPGKYRTVLMHRLVMNDPDGFKVDHVDFNTLNNQTNNLRVCNDVESCRSRRRQSNNQSGYIGVSWKADRSRWLATASVSRQGISIGTFRNIEEAAYVRDQFVMQLYGDFAVLNTPFE
jgi:hypothetical protein